MTGFSADWLGLREPVDHRSTAASVAGRVRGRLSQIENPRILDLGCGSGSSLRALAPKLGRRQRWLLVDNDARLIAAARAALTRWADHAQAKADGGLALEKSVSQIEVRFVVADVRAGVEPLLEEAPDLVTAAAFFDLAGEAWIRNFAGALIARKIPLYATLIYDGREHWSPPHSADVMMLTSFHAHQARDKGLGPAAGPGATSLLKSAFASVHWRVEAGDSTWRLDANDQALIAALADGSAMAVGETGLVDAAAIADWRAARQAATSCEIGHADLFAAPDF